MTPVIVVLVIAAIAAVGAIVSRFGVDSRESREWEWRRDDLTL